MPEFDLEKAMSNGGRCRTIDGREAMIICTDANMESGHELIVLIKNDTGKNYLSYRNKNGEWINDDGNLQNIPQRFRFERWVRVYYDARKDEHYLRFYNHNPGRYAEDTACIKVIIEGEEGQFDK